MCIFVLKSKNLIMVLKKNAQVEFVRATEKCSSLTALSNFLIFIGVIVVLVGIIHIIMGITSSNSYEYDAATRIASSSYFTTGITSIISGFFFFFFAAIGKAVNEIRILSMADFYLRHEDTDVAKKEQELEPEKIVAHAFKVGDKLLHKATMKQVRVIGINNNRITCEEGFFSGATTYDASELEPIVK